MTIDQLIKKSSIIRFDGGIERISRKHVAELIDADSEESIARLASDFNDATSNKLLNKMQLMEVLQDIRSLMIHVMTAQEFIEGEDHDATRFNEIFGLKWGSANIGFHPKKDENLQNKVMNPMEESEITRFLKTKRANDMSMITLDPYFDERMAKAAATCEKRATFAYVGVCSKTYRDFLFKGMQSAQLEKWSVDIIELEPEKAWLLIFPGASYENSDSGRIEWAKDLISVVITINLHGLKTIYRMGAFVCISDNMITSLWANFAEMLTLGRTIRCKQCGKPVIALGERGNPREFCGDACRKKHDRDEVRAKARKMYERGMPLEDAVRTIGKEALIIKSEYKKLTR